VTKYFETSRQDWLTLSGWDQTVMNDILKRIEHTGHMPNKTLHSVATRVNYHRYINFMLTSWYTSLSSSSKNPSSFYALPENIHHQQVLNSMKTSVLWHYKCAEISLTSFFAKYLTQSTDIDGYYTTEYQFLSVTVMLLLFFIRYLCFLS
jgi:hypothetical protein